MKKLSQNLIIALLSRLLTHFLRRCGAEVRAGLVWLGDQWFDIFDYAVSVIFYAARSGDWVLRRFRRCTSRLRMTIGEG